jgi:hypothetical protein
MRAVSALLFLALSGASPATAPVLSERANDARVEGRDAAIETLVMDARAAPPEFSADILLRLATSTRIAGVDWQRELLEEAYLRAYAAADAYRVTATFTPPDSRQGAQVIASDTALTRVSLQARAAQSMAFVDAARAREMFEWIDLDLVPGTCDSPLVPAVDEYYTTLAVLARRTFGTDMQGRSDALRFMSLYMWRAHLPVEMPAVARALRSFRPTADEALYLESTFRWILETSLRDPRSFSSISLDLVNRFMELEDADRNLGLTNWNVTRALRDYLVTHFKGQRCSDSLSDGPAADLFNAALKRREVGAEVVAPLAPADTRPSRLLGVARVDRYWRAIEARRLYEMGARLRGPDRMPVPDRIRMTEAWQNQAERLLTDLERWTGSREALERDYLYQKAVLYTLLIDLVPATPLRTRTLRSFVEFLRNSDRDRANRTLWFAFANRIIELTRSADRNVALEVLEESRHPVLALYGRVERALGTARRPSHF